MPLEIAYCRENVDPVVTLVRRGPVFGVLALVLAASVVLDVFKIRVFVTVVCSNRTKPQFRNSVRS